MRVLVRRVPLPLFPVTCDPLLAHAEVCELAVSVGVQQDVVQLQVAVDDAVRVQELQRQRYFRRVEPAQ